jgi:O-antigen ligase
MDEMEHASAIGEAPRPEENSADRATPRSRETASSDRNHRPPYQLEESRYQTSAAQETASSSWIAANRTRLATVAGFLYAVSMQKYATRDPLSANVGFQGIIEILSVIGAFSCILAASVKARREYRTSAASVCFFAFSLLTLASSWRSYSPALSFVKGALLLIVLATGYLASQAGLGRQFLLSIYRNYATLLVVGFVIGVLLPNQYPLFSVDDYSGRTKLSLFATHPGVTSECCGVLILLAPLLDPKPRWISLFVLVSVNFLAGEKVATGALVALLVIRFLWGQERLGRTALITATAMLGVVLTLWVFLFASSHAFDSLSHAATTVYGTKMDTEMGSLNGRTNLWRGAIGIIGNSPLLGYGVDGARDMLLRLEPWSGQSHNGFIEVALESGLFGLCFFVTGVMCVLNACLRAGRAFRISALPLLAYLLLIACVGSIFNTPLNFGVLLLLCLLYEAMRSGIPVKISARAAFVS